ncbi:MAG: FHA domain-containing protein [Acidobacteria bacterium]|nr:FHA domain-containing protein [Acidobacteriota bacterium]
MARFVIQLPDHFKPFEYTIAGDVVLIGRDPQQNDLVLHDTLKKISRKHAAVRRTQEGYVLEDTSTNGTCVNTRPIKRHLLSDGDLITMGGVILHFHLSETASRPVTIEETPLGDESVVMVRSALDVAEALPPIDFNQIEGGSSESVKKNIRQLEKKAEILSLLYELGKSLGQTFELETIFQRVIDLLFRVTPADRILILLKDRGTGELSPIAVKTRVGAARSGIEQGVVSKTIVTRVMDERVSLLSLDAQTDQQLGEVASIVLLGIHSVMCAPLAGRERVLGAIYLDRRDVKEAFTENDLDLLNAVAGQTATAVDNALAHEQLSREALARAAYGRFMPQHVVEQILSAPESVRLGGVNQVVTVLFADIRGFTPIAEKSRPEDVVRLLNQYFSLMTEIIFGHQGTLDKYIGDGLMAIFGAPYSSPDDPVNAVRAAMEMQRTVIQFNRGLVEQQLPEIKIGIGINTGEVTVGYIGSERRTDFTAIGDTVNLASRLESTAEPGQIRLSGSTRNLLPPDIPTRPLGEIKVKGKSEPVAVYECQLS